MIKSKVKYIQSLSQKKLRDEERVFVAEGPKIINELLSEGVVLLRELFALKSWIEIQPPSLVRTLGDKLQEVDLSLLSRISFMSAPNQVMAIFNKPVLGLSPELAGKLTLMTDGIQDPGNMGTIIRCADWFGIANLICSRDCADAFNPKTVQSSMGSIARVSVYYENLPAFLEIHRDVAVFASALSGDNLYDMNPLKEGIIVIGNESRGIRPEVLLMATRIITISRKGHAESLNAAVATGIILSHLAK